MEDVKVCESRDRLTFSASVHLPLALDVSLDMVIIAPVS